MISALKEYYNDVIMPYCCELKNYFSMITDMFK